MLNRISLKKSLEMIRDWYQESGVMIPENGQWGVAERILLLKGNDKAHKAMKEFPAWTSHRDKGYYVIEQRRADCNLQSAFLYLRLHEVFGLKKYYVTAHNILSFLFNRSGLLARTGGEQIEGAWNWSHIIRGQKFCFDDNAWMCCLLLKMGTHYPEFDEEFGLKEWGLELADLLAGVFPRYFQTDMVTDGIFPWQGNLHLPHYGSLVVQALAEAARIQPKKEYKEIIESYNKYLLDHVDSFTYNEYGCALLGATAAYAVYKDKTSLKVAKLFADRIIQVMDPETGNIPSSYFDVPKGEQYADTLYTLNWAVLGMQNMRQLDSAYTDDYDRIMELLLAIQDKEEAPHLKGSWHGTYNLKAKTWGGVGSIYTGSTNAPIGWAMAFALQNKCFAVH